MRELIIVIVAAALAGCGVDTVASAGTAAALKKQEVEQGKKTMEQVQQNVGQAVEQAEQNAQKTEQAASK